MVAYVFESFVGRAANQVLQPLHCSGLNEQFQQRIQVFALGRTEGFFPPFLALGLGHKLHEIVIGELRGVLPKIGPGGFKRFVLPAELGQQLAVDFLEIVTRPVSELALRSRARARSTQARA